MRAWLIPLLIVLILPIAAADAVKAGQHVSLPATQGTAAEPPPVYSWAYWEKHEKRSEIFRNLVLAIVVVIGLIAGIWRAYTAHQQAKAAGEQAKATNKHAKAANEQAEAANEQVKIAQQGHFNDRFSTAVEHLGKEQMPVRLGGIYALWRLAEVSPTPARDWEQVMDIFCAFVRSPPFPEPLVKEDEESVSIFQLRADVQAIMKFLGAEDAPYRKHQPSGYYHIFEYANLSDARLTGGNFRAAFFLGANLRGAVFLNTNLTRATLSDADFSGATLDGADLSGADIDGAILGEAQDLTQDQLDTVKPTEPPESLPEGLVWPFVENDDGDWVRKEK